MYKLIVRQFVRRTFAAMNRGDHEAPLRNFTPRTRFLFLGDHSLATDARGVEAARTWFRRAYELFPDLSFEVREIVVNGFPWRTYVANHLFITASLPDGSRYENEGMQLLVLRWGRVAEDLVFEDTQRVAAAVEQAEAVRG